MARACTKCKAEIADGAQLDMQAEKYPCCPKCWAEWKEYRVMVINEMRLDLSMPDHRKVLRKNEKIFVGVLAPDGTAVDYTNEDNRRPDEPGAGSGGGGGGANGGASQSDPPPGGEGGAGQSDPPPGGEGGAGQSDPPPGGQEPAP